MNLSHINQDNQAAMVDVGDKAVTTRTAEAEGFVQLPTELFALLQDGEHHSKKGPVIQTAILAGTMAAKQTSNLIPLCHPLPVESIKIRITPTDSQSLHIQSKVRVTHKTGVEMEALTAVSVAALTLYDMCKALSHDITISEIRLISKTGGKSDYNKE